MKKIIATLLTVFFVVLNSFSIEKSSLVFKNAPYLFETFMESETASFKLSFTCYLSRLNNGSNLKFITSPRFISKNKEIDEEFIKINNAFKLLEEVEISIPLDLMADPSGINSIMNRNVTFTNKIEDMGKELDKPSLSLASTFITYILVFSIFNVILPDINDAIEIPFKNFTLNSTVNEIITKTKIFEYKFLISREYIFPEMNGVKLSALLKCE